MKTHEDYLAEGRRLAQSYLEANDIGGNSPDVLVEKLAREQGLNAEQVRRLGRATNVALFAAKYAARAGEVDRRVDFPVVDSDAVVERLQAKEPEGPVKLAREMYPSFPTPERDAPPTTEKTAEAATPEPSAREAWTERENLWLAARELPLELGATQEKWANTLRALVPMCRRGDHDHPALEKNALAVLGVDVLPELGALRAYLKLPALPESREKYAEAREFLVGVEDKTTERLKVAMGLREQYGVLAGLLAKVKGARGSHA